MLDMTSFDAALKVRYTDEEVERLTLSDHPLLALLMKKEIFTGKALPIPIIYGNMSNRSADFATANAGTSNTLIEDFILTQAKDYAIAKIDGQTIDNAADDTGAFMDAVSTELDSAYEAASQSLSTALFRSGTGSIGIVGSVSSTTLTLATPADSVHFEVGMKLVESAADGGTLGAGSSTGEVIESIDMDAGTMESTSAAWSTVLTAIAATHYLYALGDHNAKVKGLAAWIPSAAPTSGDSFFQVDRSVNPTRLAGVRYNGALEPIETALINGAVRCAKYGGKTSHYIVSYEQFANLEHSLGAKRNYVDVKVSAEVGFSAMTIQGPKGVIKVIPDQDCQANIAWGLDLRKMALYSNKKAIRVLQRSGGLSVRASNADAEEIRVGGYFQFGIRAPGHNVRVALAT